MPTHMQTLKSHIFAFNIFSIFLLKILKISQKSSLKYHQLKMKQEQTSKNPINHQTHITEVNKKFNSKGNSIKIQNNLSNKPSPCVGSCEFS